MDIVVIESISKNFLKIKNPRLPKKKKLPTPKRRITPTYSYGVTLKKKNAHQRQYIPILEGSDLTKYSELTANGQFQIKML